MGVQGLFSSILPDTILLFLIGSGGILFFDEVDILNYELFARLIDY